MNQLARSDRSWWAEWYRTIDWPIMSASFGLLAIGLMLSLSISPTVGAKFAGYGAYSLTIKHLVFVSGASIILVGTSFLSPDWARRLCAFVFLGAFGLMAVILLFGHEAKGAQRWIQLGGMTFQPSEVVKPALIVLTAWLLSQRSLFPNQRWELLAFVFFAATMGLLLLQPDVGQAALLSAAFMLTFFVAGLPWRWATAFIGGGAGLSGVLYALLPHVRFRVNSFLSPGQYDTYQIDRASEAIARGGWFGVGPGEGRVKAALPDAHTDFIYAVASEEFGFVAALGLVGLLAFVALRGIWLAHRISDPFRRAAGVGLFALFGLQAAINLAVNVRLIPPKGMTLPFISSGGSSMLGIALTLGVALALVRQPRTRGWLWRPQYA